MAVGVASNVVQFVDFATKLVQTANELRHHTASSENRDHAIVVTHLEALASNIRDRKQAIAQSSTMASVEEKVRVSEGYFTMGIIKVHSSTTGFSTPFISTPHSTSRY